MVRGLTHCAALPLLALAVVLLLLTCITLGARGGELGYYCISNVARGSILASTITFHAGTTQRMLLTVVADHTCELPDEQLLSLGALWKFDPVKGSQQCMELADTGLFMRSDQYNEFTAEKRSEPCDDRWLWETQSYSKRRFYFKDTRRARYVAVDNDPLRLRTFGTNTDNKNIWHITTKTFPEVQPTEESMRPGSTLFVADDPSIYYSYAVPDPRAGRYSYGSATGMCQGRGGYLPTPTTELQALAVARLCGIVSNGDTLCFLGGSEVSTKTFAWVQGPLARTADGGHGTEFYSAGKCAEGMHCPWAPQQPQAGGAVVMVVLGVGGWQFATRSSTSGLNCVVVCQFDAPDPHLRQGFGTNVAGDSMVFRGYASPVERSWPNCVQQCSQLGGWLPTPTTALQFDAVTAAMLSRSLGYFLGGTDASEQRRWRWVTGPLGLANNNMGTVFHDNGMCKSNMSCPWAPGEPNGGNQQDLVWFLKGELHDMSKSLTRAFYVCQFGLGGESDVAPPATASIAGSRSASKNFSNSITSSPTALSLSHSPTPTRTMQEKNRTQTLESPQSRTVSASGSALPSPSMTVIVKDEGRFQRAKKQRSVTVRVALTDILGSEEAATATGSTGALGATAAGALSPTAPAQVGKLSALSATLRCVFSAEEDGPSYVELPLQADVGEGPFRRYVGSVLLSSFLLIITPFAVLGFSAWHVRRKANEESNISNSKSSAHRNRRSRTSQESSALAPKKGLLVNCGRVSLVLLAYISPGLVQATVTVLSHPNEKSAGGDIDGNLIGEGEGPSPTTTSSSEMAACFFAGIVAPIGAYVAVAVGLYFVKPTASPSTSSGSSNAVRHQLAGANAAAGPVDPRSLLEDYDGLGSQADSEEELELAEAGDEDGHRAESGNRSSGAEDSSSTRGDDKANGGSSRNAVAAVALDVALDPIRGGAGGHRVHRLCFAEDIGVAILTAAVAGTRPEEQSACRAVSYTCVLLAVLHLAYLGAVRPYRTRLDIFFTAVVGVLMLVLAAAAVRVQQETLGGDGDEAAAQDASVAMRVFEYSSLLLLLIFPMQAIIQLLAHIAEQQKNKKNQRRIVDDDEDGGTDMADVEPAAFGEEFEEVATGRREHHQQQQQNPLLDVPRLRTGDGDGVDQHPRRVVESH